jgi:small-conductance mechanosensitive channel
MNERIQWPARVAAWFSLNADELAAGAIVAAIAVLIMLGLRMLGKRIIASDPHCRTWRSVIGRVLAKTSIVFMIVLALDLVANYTVPPPKIAHPLDIAFVIVAAIQGAIWARELIMGIVTREAGDEVGETALDNARSVIRVLVSVALFAIAIIVILDNLGVNVTALVAGLGIGGIAIGLAAQGIFSDLFAALAILLDKPFRRGETIRYDDSVGTVEKIGLKTTRLRSLTGEGLVMSNKNLLDREIHNFAEGHSRRTTFVFNIIYQTPPELLEQIPEIVAGVVKTRSGCHFVRCAITNLAASSIDYEMVFESATVDADMVGADRTAIVVELVRAFALHGIEFAYPTQTTFTAAPDGTMIMPYAAPAKGG